MYRIKKAISKNCNFSKVQKAMSEVEMPSDGLRQFPILSERIFSDSRPIETRNLLEIEEIGL